MKKGRIYVAVFAALIMPVVITTGCINKSHKNTLAETEKMAVAYVENMHNRDVVDVMQGMQSIEQSREDATKESIRESISIAEYVSQSIAESIAIAESESVSLAQYLEESRRESEAAAYAAYLAASIEAESRKMDELIQKQPVGMDVDGITVGRLHQGYVIEGKYEDIPAIRKLFQDVVVIGDSRAKGIVDCDILTESNVSFFGGAVTYNLFGTAANGAHKMKGKALFILGLNDLGGYHGDSARFSTDVKKLIDSYLAINPNSKIYIQDILPVLESGRYAWPMMDYRGEFNSALENLCNTYGYTFVRVSDYALPQYVNSQDGAHYSQKFYLLWGQAVANQMNLWGDL